MSLKKDAVFVQINNLDLTSDQLTLVRLPKKPRKNVNKFDIEHDHEGSLWCGPAAVSAITGASTSAIRDLVKKYRKNAASVVSGTTVEELEYVFKKLGYRMEVAYVYGGKRGQGPTLKEWIADTEGERVPGLGYLIGIAGERGKYCGHWAMILNEEYVCSNTIKWVPLNKAKYRRRRVDQVFTVRKVK